MVLYRSASRGRDFHWESDGWIDTVLELFVLS